MGRRCFAPNCRSGSKSCKEKVFSFKAPDDPQRLQAWANAIPRKDRQLTSADYICETHFADGMIKRDRYYGELGGEVILDVPKKPVLLPEAVPCIFPGYPPLLPSAKKKGEAPKSRPSIAEESSKPGTEETFDCRTGGMSDTGSNLQIKVEPQTDSSSCESPEPTELPEPLDAIAEDLDMSEAPEIKYSALLPSASDLHLQTTEVCLKRIFSQVMEVTLPSRAWFRRDISTDGIESICFVELKKASETLPVFVNKSLEITESLVGSKISQCVLEREVSSTVVQDAPDITDMLNAFHNQIVCCGGPAREQFPDIKLKCASVDKSGCWRHKRCRFLLDNEETQCIFCKRLYNTIYVNKARKQRAERRLGILGIECNFEDYCEANTSHTSD